VLEGVLAVHSQGLSSNVRAEGANTPFGMQIILTLSATTAIVEIV